MSWDPWNEDIEGLHKEVGKEYWDEHSPHFTFLEEMYGLDEDENGVSFPVLMIQSDNSREDIREKYDETSEYRQEILDELSFDEVRKIVSNHLKWRNVSVSFTNERIQWLEQVSEEKLGLNKHQLRYFIVDSYTRYPELRDVVIYDPTDDEVRMDLPEMEV